MGGFEAITPTLRSPQQGDALVSIGLELLQGRQGRGRQWRSQGGGVAESAGALQQPLAHDSIGREEGTASAEGFAEGAAHQAHSRQAPGQPAAAGAKHSQGMGFVHQQQGAELLAGRGDAGQIGGGSFHAEQAFAHHQSAPARLVLGPALQQAAQVAQIVVAKAPQPGTAGLDPHQQGVVDQAVGDHLAVAVGQGQHRGQVGLKAAGEEQHPLAPKPLGQGRLELVMAWSRAAHQSRSAAAHPVALDRGHGRRLQAGVGAESEIVVAGQIEQAPNGRAGFVRQEGGVWAWAECAQPSLPLLGNPAEGLLDGIERIRSHAEVNARAVALTPLCLLGSP